MDVVTLDLLDLKEEIKFVREEGLIQTGTVKQTPLQLSKTIPVTLICKEVLDCLDFGSPQ